MKLSLFTAALCVYPALGSRLYAASYAGNVSSLSLTTASNGTGHLSIVSQSADCGPSPSWLTLDKPRDILYCLDEGIDAPNGSITSFHTHANGSLTAIKHLETIIGPVMSTWYPASGVPDRQFMAVAHYSGSAVTTYSVDPAHGLFDRIQTFNFHMDGPGPNPSRQDAPHPHGAYLDPTGLYVFVPDLGADLIRVFAICQKTGHLKPVSPLETDPGLGPRHIAFWTPKGAKTDEVAHDEAYFYLVAELGNSLTGYKVGYSSSGPFFTKFYNESTFGQQKPSPAGSKAAEIAISPQNSHIIITNRFDASFGHDKDSFSIFSCANDDGTIPSKPSFLGLQPAYGSNPRQFEISDAHNGHFVAVALQSSREVVVTRWDEQKDVPGGLFAKLKSEGEVPSVIWS